MVTSGIGGEVITYSRMSKWLSDNTDYDIYWADIPEGASFSYIKKRNHNNIKQIYLNVIKNEKGILTEITDTVFPDNCTVFTNGFFLLSNSVLKHIKGQNIRFLFYFVEPHTYLDQLQNKSLLSKIIKKITLRKKLKIANANNALIYQDYPNFRNITNYCSKLDKRYLPIPIYHKQARQTWKLSPDNIHFCYIGRNCKTKNKTLYFFAQQLENYTKKYNNLSVSLNIVSNIEKTDKIYIKLKQHFPNLKIILQNTLYEKNLEKFLAENIDIVLGMGVSCLEATKIGLPAISAPASLHKIPLKTKVGTICDFKDFALGGYLNEDNGLHNGRLFSNLLDDIRQNYNKYAMTNYTFTQKHFDINTIMHDFLKYIDKTSFEHKDLGN